MLGNLYQIPASTRSNYAFEAAQDTSSTGNPVRKAIMVALMALAAGLFLILPDGEDEVFALEAASGGQQSDVAVPQPTTDSTFVREVSSGESQAADDAATAQVAVATEAALTAQRHKVGGGISISSAGELMEEARAAAARMDVTSTTAAPVIAAPAKQDTTTTESKPTTTAPESTVDNAEDSSTTETPATTVAAESDTSTETAEDGTTSSSEAPTTTAADGETSDSTDGGDTSTTAPPTSQAPETTVPPETTTTAADNGWVDTGNGVLVPAVLLEIRRCESQGNYTAANPSSSARGAYQFLTGSWAAYGHKDRYGVNQAHLATPAQQDEAALTTWERDGTRPWNASKHCWG